MRCNVKFALPSLYIANNYIFFINADLKRSYIIDIIGTHLFKLSYLKILYIFLNILFN